MSRLAEESSYHMQELGLVLNTFNEMAAESSNNAKYINNIFLVSGAKIDHIVIKSTAYQRVLSENQADTLPNHLNCRFGKWYSGEGKEQFGDTKAFKSIDKPHENLHNKINANMNFVKEGNAYNPSNSKEIIENFKSMEASSVELFAHLESMIKE